MHPIHKGPTKALASAQTLTGSLVASTEACDVSLASHCELHVDYAQGTGGTSPKLELEVETRCESSDTWRDPSVGDAGTPSGGAVAIALTTTTYTLAATAGVSFTVPCHGARDLRVKVRETGTPSPYGSVSVRAVPVRLGGA